MKIVKGKFNRAATALPDEERKRKTGFSMDPTLHEIEFRPSMFYVPGHDAQGHGVRVVAMIHPKAKRAIQATLARGVIPQWYTEGDFIRWAIQVGLAEVTKLKKDPAVKSAFAKMAILTEMQQQIYDNNNWRQLLHDVQNQVAAFVTEKEFVSAMRLLKSAESYSETIEETRWQQRYESTIARLYNWTRRQMKVHESKTRRGRHHEDD